MDRAQTSSASSRHAACESPPSAPVRVRALAKPPERDASGIAARYRLEQEGLLHHVTPLGSAARREVSGKGRFGQVGAALLAAAREHNAAGAETGYVLIHLKNPAHRTALLRRLTADHDLVSVSKVAARYIWAASNPAGGFLPPERKWNHTRIQLAAARKLPACHPPGNIRVAVLDSGVQIRHPSHKGRGERIQTNEVTIYCPAI